MITIDGIRYISQKTYGELLGIAPSTVSLKKAKLPIQHFDEINMDLINFDLLELADEVLRNAELRVATRETLPTYTATQLGEFFIAMVTRLTDQASSATQLRLEAEAALTRLQEEFATSQKTNQILQQQVDGLQGQLVMAENQLTQAREEFSQKMNWAEGHILTLTEETNQLMSDKNGLQVALNMLESIMSRVSSPAELETTPQEKPAGKKMPKSTKAKS